MQICIRKIIIPYLVREMSTMPPTNLQHGGFRTPVIEEIKLMSGYFVILFLVLVSVYVSRIPESISNSFRTPVVQGFGLLSIILLTLQYGWIHGILAALAFSLLISRALRNTPKKQIEGLQNYSSAPAFFLSNSDNTTFVPTVHRWFGEKVLGENPFLIREKEVNTSAVQDYSDRTMGTNASNVSR